MHLAEGAVNAEAKLRAKEEAQGVLEAEKEVPNRLILLASEERIAFGLSVEESCFDQGLY